MKQLLILLILFISLSVLSVNAMSLKGAAVTRYDPCGVALIHFDKITQNLWKCVLSLIYYKNYPELEVEIHFNLPVTLYMESNSFLIQSGGQNFIFKAISPIPEVYSFHVFVNGENGSNIPVVKKLMLNKYVLCDSVMKFSEIVNNFGVANYQHSCGRRAFANAELSSMRTTTNAGDWPWHVALLKKDPITNIDTYICGGSIISTTAVLTAGHCVSKNGFITDARSITILAGISNLRISNEIGRQVYVPTQVILHPTYNDQQATADLAILRVNYIQYTMYVQPVCIWGPGYNKTKLFGIEATVVGFGTTEENKLSDSLRSANIMVQNDYTCIESSPVMYSSLLNDFTLCAGLGPYSEISPKEGDSGGGLVIWTVHPDSKTSWYIIGIVSRCEALPGKLWCNPRSYLIYTYAASHFSWIYQNAGLI